MAGVLLFGCETWTLNDGNENPDRSIRKAVLNKDSMENAEGHSLQLIGNGNRVVEYVETTRVDVFKTSRARS